MFIRASKEPLKRIASRHPECQQPAAAEVRKTTDTPAKVDLTRTFDTHGENTACISSDVIRPDGKLDSFYRYYSGFPDAR